MPSRLLLNPASLNLVRPELALLIKQARTEFEQAMQPDSGHGLDACREHLAQIDGVLRLIELGDAARFARELRELLGTDLRGNTRAAEAAARAFFVLARYLDYLSGRRRAVPELLVEDINALRAQHGAPALGEAHFGEYPGADSVHYPGRAGAGAALDEALLRRLRHMYQVGLLGIIKGRADPVHLHLMRRSAGRMLRLAAAAPQADFWWLLDGVLEGFALGELKSNAARNRLLSRADRQFKDLGAGTPSAPEESLRQELLGLVSRCRGGSRITEIRAAFGIEEAGLNDQQLAEERALLMGTSVDSIDSMVRVLRGDLHKIKDELEQAGGSGTLRADALPEMRETLERVAGVLRDGGLRSSAATLEAQLEKLNAAAASEEALAREDLLAIADALVYVETTLSGLGRAQGLAKGLREQQSSEGAGESATRQMLDDARHTMLQSAREAIEAVKRAVTAYIESDFDAQSLAPAGALLLAVRGALYILEHARAATIAAATAASVERRSSGGTGTPPESFSEALADVLICLEYYVAALENAEEPDPLMLKLADESLAQIAVASGEATG